MLCVQNLSYSYSNFSLQDININVPHGQIAYLLGPSGCGKSTLLRLIVGLHRTDQGSITIDNRVVTCKKVFINVEKRQIGLIFQHPSLFPHKTVRENVLFAVQDKKEHLAEELLKEFDMEQYADHFPHMLSGGQQQLIALARALAHQPLLLLLDEPFSNLDTILKITIRKKIFTVLQRKKITTLIVTHDPVEALTIADVIYVMNKGRIIQEGTPQRVYEQPVNLFVASFFESLNCETHLVSDGYINTVWGKIPIKKHTDKVLLCIRSHAIVLAKTRGIKAIVKRVQFFTNTIEITVNNKLYQMKSIILHNENEVIYVTLDFDKVLIFSDY